MGVVIKQSIKGTFFAYSGALIGIFTTFYIIPKYVGAELLGLKTVLTEAALFFTGIFQLGASSSIIRFFPHFKSAKSKTNNGFFFYLICLISVGFLLFVCAFFLLRQPIIDYFSSQSILFVDYLYWVIPLTFFMIYWTSFEVYSNVLMKIAIPKLIREIVIRVLFIFLYLAYALKYINLTEFIIGFVAIYGMVTLLVFLYVAKIGSVSLKHEHSFITPPLKKDFCSYSSIFVLGALGGSLLGRMDIFMISGEMGLVYTGVYAIAINMISLVDMPSRSISAISAPIVADALKRGDLDAANKLYKKVSSSQLLIGSMIFLLIWINIDNIYAIISDISNENTFSAGKYVVLLIGSAKLIELTIGFGGTLINFSRYYHWSLYFAFFITGINLFLNWLFIPKWGIVGAAVATMIASSISYCLQQWLVFQKVKANPYSKNTLKILIMIALVLLVNVILPQLDNYYVDTVYRTFIVGILMGVFVYFSKVSEETNNIIRSLLFKMKKDD
ncbi:MAG: oligosaccharide flippase family protein [Dysgonamonadaceae bacterium]|jgi:O-antigen/teichoic acid export membrane protein|nr:oligosaccharide flippase family protein [Dysgonamonadaceae bacterium]